MHMWMWFGYNLGDFMFAGLEVSTRWAFALTWIVLFFVALLFEASKVYLANVQRNALRTLYPCRSDERHNLLCGGTDYRPIVNHQAAREQGAMEPTTSRNASTGQVGRWASLRIRVLVNVHQAAVFLLHNVVGYLLMLAVMLYNVHLVLAVVFGMMLGYFLFGPKLTRMQMKCFRTKRVVICTPECDDTADSTTPPLLGSSTESDLFACQTRTCIQPSHYFRASTSQEGAAGETANATCYYGAKKCPSKVARVKKMQAVQDTSHCHVEDEKSTSVEDAQLLRTERQGCCKMKQEPPPGEKKCCGEKTSQVEVIVAVHESRDEAEAERPGEARDAAQAREDSPQITCCNKAKSVPADSQEQIVK